MATQAIKVMTSGMVVTDIIAAGLERFAEPGEMMYVEDGLQVHLGGHPANVALDLAQLGMDPASIGVIASVGKDVFGSFIEGSLRAKGIQTFFQKNSKRPTSKNMIAVIKGEDRRFHLDPGANLSLSVDHVRGTLEEHQPQAFCCRPGYSGIDNDMARIYGVIPESLKVLDMCRPYRKEWSYIRPALRFIDVFHANKDEAMATTDTSTVTEAVEALLDQHIQVVLLTGGEEGALLATANFTIRQKGFSVEAIDPTGCGDAFTAGFVKVLLDKGVSEPAKITEKDAKKMLIYAQACGAACAQAVGCSTGVTDLAVERIAGREAPETIGGW